MDILKKPFFIISCALFIAHQVLQKIMHVPMGFIDHHLDNLLLMPILLTLLVAERRVIFKRGAQYRLSKTEVVMATALIVVVVEIIFPALSRDFKTDWFDLAFYSLGSVIFYLTINPDKV
jgi:hypothetical protein